MFSNVSSVRLPETMHGYIFSTVCFQKSAEMACLRRCIVTLVAFLSDPGVPGVRSMGPDVTEVVADLIDVTLADKDTN